MLVEKLIKKLKCQNKKLTNSKFLMFNKISKNKVTNNFLISNSNKLFLWFNLKIIKRHLEN